MIRIHILGSAAGGGLPQWNCACANCLAARAGKIAPQTQSSIAITSDSEKFQRSFLINASPDLARQIENTAQLQPGRDSLRNTPIAGVLLTNADIDHALGLLLLRERETPLIAYASDQTRTELGWLDHLLARFCRIQWRKITAEFQSLDNGIEFRAIELPQSIAFQLRDETSKRLALVAPAVGELSPTLRQACDSSDIILFDGTFWSESELAAVRPGARTARQTNHLPISDGSLEFLRQSPAHRKIYTHVNNTNPIFMPASPERTQVEQAGIEIAHDGLEVVV